MYLNPNYFFMYLSEMGFHTKDKKVSLTFGNKKCHRERHDRRTQGQGDSPVYFHKQLLIQTATIRGAW